MGVFFGNVNQTPRFFQLSIVWLVSPTTKTMGTLLHPLSAFAPFETVNSPRVIRGTTMAGRLGFHPFVTISRVFGMDIESRSTFRAG